MKSAVEALHEDLAADMSRTEDPTLNSPAPFKFAFRDGARTPDQMSKAELLHVIAYLLEPPPGTDMAADSMYSGYLCRPENPGARIWLEDKPNRVTLWIVRLLLGLVWVP